MNKRLKSVSIVLLSLVVSTSLLLSGCGSAAPNTPQSTATKKDTIAIAIPSEPSTMDVQFADDGNMRAVTDNVIESLLTLDGKTMKVIPALATEVSRIDNTTWDIKLRPNVTFQNGNPFTADDVVYSIKRIIDPNFKSNIAGFFATFKDAQKIGDLEVHIITTGPDPSMPTRLTLLDILNQKEMLASPDKIKTAVSGTGPYKIASWMKGQRIVLERNDNYWGTKPAIKTVNYRFIEEDATRAAALRNGEIDFATNMLPEYVSTLPQIQTAEGLEFSLVRMNAVSGVMKDQKIRQAASYAINWDAISKSLYQGYASIAPGQVLKPSYFGFNKNLKAYPFDLAKAKQLLAEAGYKGETITFVGEQGRWLKDGEQEQAIAQMLRDAGFKVDVKMLAFSQWLGVLFPQDPTSTPPDMIFTFHSNDIYDADRTYSTYVLTTGSASSYPKTLDAQIIAARTELDTTKRQQEYEAISQTLYDNPAWLNGINIKDIDGMGKDVVYQPREDMRLKVSEMSFK
ncbi:ABC-type transporter, extracellular solute-binding protein family 5 [Candidatus Desulfosporosinus infrequens]|uniref:ABC-type transporter, extracellular solute-binding protein family 5 n=1 Tax=Candidatus Desulfosporosinus infrequens TaxID=2043169 RepID=A0A2U3LYT3_9FIRM|nr:ABC-type transporter, extracellular solute-binding protein family 5 [Candidatus Desulfosporosinus infrequens]